MVNRHAQEVDVELLRAAKVTDVEDNVIDAGGFKRRSHDSGPILLRKVTASNEKIAPGKRGKVKRQKSKAEREWREGENIKAEMKQLFLADMD